MDALFAESDDDVVVVPQLPTVDTTVSSVSESAPQPVSSNYVNSTTPTRPYEVNVAPLSHPSQSRTPVPEEYQPLPDSSSSFDYSMGPANPDSSSSENRPNPINIRYQPKPHWPKNFCLPPAWDPMYINSLIGSYSGVFNPVSYAMDTVAPQYSSSLQSNNNNNEPMRENPPPINANESAPVDAPNPTAYLERPSRQLNISPGRRQSRESESNPIELSSEEEDNAPKKRLCENVAGNSVGPTNLSRKDAQAGSSREPPPVTVKSEPHDLSVPSARQEAILPEPISVRTREEAPLPLTTRQETANPPPAEETGERRELAIPSNSSSFLPVKTENHHMCLCGNYLMYGHVNTNQCGRPIPRPSENRMFPGHRFHHHHHHHHHDHHHHHHNRNQMPRHSFYAQVKTEPSDESTNNSSRPIKQEPPDAHTSPTAASQSGLQLLLLAAMNSARQEVDPQPQVQVKIEPTNSEERVQVKRERSSPEVVDNVPVKMEADDLRTREVDGGGDRGVASPQPGPSSAFVSVVPKLEVDTNSQQVTIKLS